MGKTFKGEKLQFSACFWEGFCVVVVLLEKTVDVENPQKTWKFSSSFLYGIYKR